MDEINCSVKTSLCMKEWIAQADFPKGANMVKKNEWSFATPLFKYNDTLNMDRSMWCFQRNTLSLQKSDASNRFF